MDSLWSSLTLLFNSTNDVLPIVFLSLKVSISASLIALIIGLPLACLLATKQFPGHRFIRIMCDTLMAQPAVVVGLVVYLLLSRNGPLGVLGLLYSPAAMIIAQTLLITPLVIALAYQILQLHWQRIGWQLQLLGLPTGRRYWLVLGEAKVALLTVALAAFGRAIAEIGAVMIVGGNIEHHTRVMTTAIAMETQKGNLEFALALGIVLMLIALLVSILSHCLSHRFSSNTDSVGR